MIEAYLGKQATQHMTETDTATEQAATASASGDRAPLLELDDLHVFYGNIEALKGVSMTVDTGEIVTLIGSNGAGKSTTLRAISGTHKPADGQRSGWRAGRSTTSRRTRSSGSGSRHSPGGPQGLQPDVASTRTSRWARSADAARRSTTT